MFADAVRDKLREHDVNADRIPVDKFIENMLSSKEEKFVWQDGLDGGRGRTASLGFTDDEAHELSGQIFVLLRVASERSMARDGCSS